MNTWRGRPRKRPASTLTHGRSCQQPTLSVTSPCLARPIWPTAWTRPIKPASVVHVRPRLLRFSPQLASQTACVHAFMTVHAHGLHTLPTISSHLDAHVHSRPCPRPMWPTATPPTQPASVIHVRPRRWPALSTTGLQRSASTLTHGCLRP